MTEDRSSKLDRLLDSALGEYGSAEPRPGLEGRVVAGLRSAAVAAAASPPGRGWRAALAFLLRPAAAGVLAAAILAALLALYFVAGGGERPASPPREIAQGRESAAPPRPGASTSPGPAAPVRPATEPAAALARRPSLRPTHAHRALRRDSFPAAAPLTEQERLLLVYVSAVPREEVAARSGFLDEPAPLPPLPVEPASRP